MQAILLAAGRGMRMMPLTLSCPKPLLYYGKYRLIEYNLFNLSKSGIKDVIINVSYRSQDFITALGYGEKYGLKIRYMFEPLPGLETGGTAVNALSLLDDEPFIMLSSDIVHNYPLSHLLHLTPKLAHLLLIPPNLHNYAGDFNFVNNKITKSGKYTYANIGVFNPTIFKNWPIGTRIALKHILKPLLSQGLDADIINESYYWKNITTPSNLKNSLDIVV